MSAYLSNGSRAQFLAGNVTHLTGSTWPLAGTDWSDLYLSSAPIRRSRRSTPGRCRPSRRAATQLYPFLPSEVTETDLHNTALVDTELDQLGQALPELNDMALSNLTSLTYTSPPLTQPFTMVGPGALDVQVASLEPVTDIYAVWPTCAGRHGLPGRYRRPAHVLPERRAFVLAERRAGRGRRSVQRLFADLKRPVREGRGAYQVELLPMGNVFRRAPGSGSSSWGPRSTSSLRYRVSTR